MSRLGNLHSNPVLFLSATALVSGAIVIAVAVTFQFVIDRESHETVSNARALSAAVTISNSGDEIVGLGLDRAAGATAGSGAVGHVPLADAALAHGYVEKMVAASARLVRLDPSTTSIDIQARAEALSVAFVAYLVNPGPETYAALITQTRALHGVTEAEVIAREAALLADQSALRSRTRLSSDAIIIVALITSLVTTTAAWVIGRRLRGNVRAIETEKRALVDANQAIGRRNQQFASLYQIVSEINETLSLTYVVRTTIREARKLVRADLVELRLLDHGALVLAGADDGGDGGQPPPAAIVLGIGVQGRVAKRGRTIRVGTDADAMTAVGECSEAVQSGVVVPLIVGARVIGTLACWSRTSHLFDADDERALELMASQVATAVAAADMHEKTEQAALHDALTGVPNRRQLSVDLASTLVEYVARQCPTVVAMIDVDHFKRFNDDFGHRVGDVTLQRVAEIIKLSIRETDHLYRYGGEEFVVVFGETDPERGRRLCERVRQSVGSAAMTGENLEPIGQVTVSIGMAAYPKHASTLDELIRLADLAMYEAKQAGRDRVVVAQHEPEARAA